MHITILGSGSSSGVPAIGLGWGDCDPNEPKNRRRRSGLLLETFDKTVLFDTGPDLRAQLIDANVNRLDAVFYTHAHADHAHGIDELRWICQSMNAPLDVYGTQETMNDLDNRFGYCFTEMGTTAHNYYYKPVLKPQIISDEYPSFKFGDHLVQPFEQDHGFSKSVGYRIDNFAYSTDVVELDERAFKILEGIDTWVLGCLQPKPHQTHIHLDKAIKWVERVKPRLTVLTHMNTKMDYRTVQKQLPDHIQIGYDGLTINI
ncbi:MBL fold metallo-hydrolase [Curvivirga sp.]|uniref:MBL fold metallo-hydrolase n=1 Tax=Curvivirga sp. TaxID=2856848 RepID=UPI003B59849D